MRMQKKIQKDLGAIYLLLTKLEPRLKNANCRF